MFKDFSLSGTISTMYRHRKHIAVFVLAFICLNAGGALCVGYCQTFDVAAETEHCPLKKASEHCNKSEQTQTDSYVIAAESSEVDCCPLTISFFAAPVEDKTFSYDSYESVSVTVYSLTAAVFLNQRRFLSDIAYRGPPLDRRVNRLKHCIIRI